MTDSEQPDPKEQRTTDPRQSINSYQLRVIDPQPLPIDPQQQIYAAVTESTPSSPPASAFQQVLWLRNTSSFTNSIEYRKYVDERAEGGAGSYTFGCLASPKPSLGRLQAWVREVQKGDNPLYREEGGWQSWPKESKGNRYLELVCTAHEPALRLCRRMVYRLQDLNDDR